MFEKILEALSGKLLEQARLIVDDVTTSKEEKLEKLLELYRLEVQDRHSARQREMALRNTVGVWVQNTCAILVIMGFLATLIAVIYFPKEIPNKTLADIMLGSLGTIVITIFNYWYGSSKHAEEIKNLKL
ncbi:MAG: hypothetical protein RML38_10360 [Bacteroidia bacterium]|nr:hypothetical protein [Bacteroidia bacterium]